MTIHLATEVKVAIEKSDMTAPRTYNHCGVPWSLDQNLGNWHIVTKVAASRVRLPFAAFSAGFLTSKTNGGKLDLLNCDSLNDHSKMAVKLGMTHLTIASLSNKIPDPIVIKATCAIKQIKISNLTDYVHHVVVKKQHKVNRFLLLLKVHRDGHLPICIRTWELY